MLAQDGGFSFPPQYGAAMLGVSCTFLANIAGVILVVKARKKYDIKYPWLYAPESHKNKKEFDCVQRAHQNFLEGLPLFNFSVLLCGLQFPVFAGVCGLGWSASMILKMWGYANGGPQGRQWGGGLAHLFDLPLMLATFYAGYLML